MPRKEYQSTKKTFMPKNYGPDGSAFENQETDTPAMTSLRHLAPDNSPHPSDSTHDSSVRSVALKRDSDGKPVGSKQRPVTII